MMTLSPLHGRRIHIAGNVDCTPSVATASVPSANSVVKSAPPLRSAAAGIRRRDGCPSERGLARSSGAILEDLGQRLFDLRVEVVELLNQLVVTRVEAVEKFARCGHGGSSIEGGLRENHRSMIFGGSTECMGWRMTCPKIDNYRSSINDSRRNNPSAASGAGRDAVPSGNREPQGRPGKVCRATRLTGGARGPTSPAVGVNQIPVAIGAAKTGCNLPDVQICAGGVDGAGRMSLQWRVPDISRSTASLPGGRVIADESKIGHNRVPAGKVNYFRC
jgi:hypothetical protein